MDLQTSILNQTRQEVVTNRAKIENLATWIQNILTPRVNELSAIMNITLHRLARLEHAFDYEKTVSLLEQVTAVYREYVQKYWRQKASLELGRLTEDILSWTQLIEVMKQATGPYMMPVTPLQWYYNHVLIYPVWGGEVLILE